MQEFQLTVNTLHNTIYLTAFNLGKRSEKDVLELLWCIQKVPSTEKRKILCWLSFPIEAEFGFNC